jgi:hypothetical protein
MNSEEAKSETNKEEAPKQGGMFRLGGGEGRKIDIEND